MKKEKTVRTYQRRTKSGKMVTVREHKASYDAAEEALKAAAKKAGAGSELSKKKAIKEESPLGFSADDYKEWYHWDMEDDANNEAALRVEKALIKKMGKKAYNKYLEDMTNSYSARGHKKAHQALLDEHTASQKKQDAESVKAAKDIARGAKEKSPTSSNDKEGMKEKILSQYEKHKSPLTGEISYYKAGKKKREYLTEDEVLRKEGFAEDKTSKAKAKHWSETQGDGSKGWSPEQKSIINHIEDNTGYPAFSKSNVGKALSKIGDISDYSDVTPTQWKSLHAAMLKDQKSKKDDGTISHRDESTFWTKDIKSKKVGDQFSYSEGRGKDKMNYDAQFVTDGKGKYKFVLREKGDGKGNWATGVMDGYERHSQLPAGLRKAAEAQGLKFKGGEFVKSSDKPSNKYGGLTKSEYENWQKDFNKRVKDADKGTRAKYSFTDIKKKIKSADISEAARKRLLKSIEKPYAVVTPTTMEKRLQKELDKKKKPSTKTSGGAPTSAALRKQADEMDARSYKETSKATHKKLIEKGYKKHTYQGTTYYHKGKEGSYGGSYVMLDKNGKQQTVPAYMKEGMKAQIARSVGKTYKARRLK